MDEFAIFQASGDACPICMSLTGMRVPSGHQAHDGCACITVPDFDGGACEAVACDIDYQGGTAGHVFVGFEVTVACPNGDEMGATGQVDVDSVVDNPIEEVWDAIERLADELCGQCSPEVREFNVV